MGDMDESSDLPGMAKGFEALWSEEMCLHGIIQVVVARFSRGPTRMFFEPGWSDLSRTGSNHL